MDAVEIVERIMTMHWDMAACPCWVCRAGRAAGHAPRLQYRDTRREYSLVWVEDENPEKDPHV